MPKVADHLAALAIEARRFSDHLRTGAAKRSIRVEPSQSSTGVPPKSAFAHSLPCSTPSQDRSIGQRHGRHPSGRTLGTPAFVTNPARPLPIALWRARFEAALRAVSHIFRTSPVERPNAEETKMWLACEDTGWVCENHSDKALMYQGTCKRRTRQAYVDKQSGRQQRTRRTRPIRPCNR